MVYLASCDDISVDLEEPNDRSLARVYDTFTGL